jgi:predicted acyl esterase
MTDPDFHRTEVRDGMQIEWQVPIEMDDGIVLRADVYRPIGDGQYPVVLSYGPYAKGLAFQEGYPMQWEQMVDEHPDVAAGSSNKYQSWEVVDPEKWVPHGYVCVRVDSRGTGWSPGYVDVWGPREVQDMYECIEWAGQQAWSSGKVGVNGISYYAINQWQVAALQPPHLAAIIPWEGAADFYRDVTHHGGILSEFCQNWYVRQVESVQYGLGSRAPKNPNTGESVAGPVDLDQDELVANRQDLGAEIRAAELDGPWYRDRSADFSKIQVPLLSAANWGGQGLHPRGNFEGFTQSGSSQKWLEVHGESHWSHFYTDYGRDLQLRFFDRFLKGEEERWPDSPRVRLNIRRPGENFTLRHEEEWPLARTRWTKFYLDAATGRLTEQRPEQPASIDYAGLGDGATFELDTLDHDLEITGPLAAKLFAASETVDADFFLVLRVFDPAGEEVTFFGALDPNTPIAQGWLRASHRKLDPARSLPYRPWHTHDEKQPLEPGQVYEFDVEMWPTSIVVPAGYRVAFTVRGKDYEYRGEVSDFAKNFYYANKGVGPFTHAEPTNRPADIFGGTVSLRTGGEQPSYVLLPVIDS